MENEYAIMNCISLHENALVIVTNKENNNNVFYGKNWRCVNGILHGLQIPYNNNVTQIDFGYCDRHIEPCSIAIGVNDIDKIYKDCMQIFLRKDK